MEGKLDIDILMITYNRPRYTRMALERLLKVSPQGTRVWVWQNGSHKETLETVRSFAGHDRIERIHHSPENQMLRGPTNWFWENAKGRLLGKVDDDCLMPPGWIETLWAVHESNPRLGVISCWPFLAEDYRPELAERKLCDLRGGGRLLCNCWTGGSGYLVKRKAIDESGGLQEGESFADFCIHLAKRGWRHGWYYPFLYMDHMDDPRSPNTEMTSEKHFRAAPSLSSRRFGTSSLEEMRSRAVQAAIDVQAASPDVRHYIGWRRLVRRVKGRLSRHKRIVRFDA